MWKNLTLIAALAATPVFSERACAAADFKPVFAHPDRFERQMGVSLYAMISDPVIRIDHAVSEYSGLAIAVRAKAFSHRDAADLIAMDQILTCWPQGVTAERLENFTTTRPARRRAEPMQIARGTL